MSSIANPIGMKLQSFGSKKILSNFSETYPEGSLLTSEFLCDVIKPPRKQKKNSSRTFGYLMRLWQALILILCVSRAKEVFGSWLVAKTLMNAEYRATPEQAVCTMRTNTVKILSA